MPERGWLGYSRRWFRGQAVAEPNDVRIVGHDESDGAQLNVASGVITSAGADHAALRMATAGPDVILERIFATSTAPLPWVALLLFGFAAGVGPAAPVLHPCTTEFTREATVNAAFATGPRIPTGLWVKLGLIVPENQQFIVIDATPATTLSAVIVFREAL